MLILTELVIPIAYGVLHLLEQLVLLASSVLVISPEVAGPSYAPSRRAAIHRVLGPIRAVVTHPGRLALALGVVAICIAALWRP